MAAVKLRPYQSRALKQLKQDGSGALYLPPGAGKTLIIIKWLRHLSAQFKKRGEDFKVLIIAPKIIIFNSWPDEFQKWDPKFKVCNIRAEGYLEDAEIYLVNPERFVSDVEKGEKYYKNFRVFIADESTIFKNPFSKRTSIVLRILGSINVDIPHRAIMTGNVVTRSLLDIWGQHTIVDRSAFDREFTHFRSRYFFPDVNGYDWDLRPGSEEKIIDRVRPRSFMLRDQDLDEIGYPRVLYNDIYFELNDKARKQYKDLHTAFLLEFEEIIGNLSIKFDITKYLNRLTKGCMSYNYCSQFVNGFLYDNNDDKKPARWIHKDRVEAAKGLIESLNGENLLLLYSYKADGQELKKISGAKLIDGSVSDADRTKIIKAWNNGAVPVLACQISVVARGLNLQSGGNHALFYGIPVDFDLYKQAFHRLVRIGQKNRVTIHRLICRGTIDHRRKNILEGKIETFEKFREELLK